jgi:hypothetical protein
MSRVLVRCSGRGDRVRRITEQLVEHLRWSGHDVDVSAAEGARTTYDLVIQVDSIGPADVAKLECSPAYGPM